MKILNTQQIRDWDLFTIAHEPISSIDLMERASKKFVTHFSKQYDKTNPVFVFCGLGNNGGDGLAIARLLLELNYEIQVFVIRYAEKSSADFALNYQRLGKLMPIQEIKHLADFPNLPKNAILIDAIFGSGLSRNLTGLTAEVVLQINAHKTLNTIIAVDIPSGLQADQITKGEAIIQAYQTFTFQTPKLAFLFPQNADFVGDWQVLDIQLNQDYLENIETPFEFLEKKDFKSLLKNRKKFSHKGSFGHGLLLAGSFGKIGAAVLAAKAALKSGIGLLTVHIPECAYEILQISVPEAMASVDISEKYISALPNLEAYNAIGVGCGLGKHALTLGMLTELLQKTKVPLVIDADALNLIAENKYLLEILPPNSILTPHPKEFERLTRQTPDNFERLEILRNFAAVYKVYVVLKGANSAIATPEGKIYFNSTGNAGMATGGSGDVLTGIITSLLAQNYTSYEASLLGVFLHGLAGDLALQHESQESLIASNIIECLGLAFEELRK